MLMNMDNAMLIIGKNKHIQELGCLLNIELTN